MTAIRYTNFDGLLNIGVSDFLMEDNELTACKNVWIYQIGKLEKVPGYTKSDASQVIDTNSVNFLHHYYQPSTKTDRLLAFSDSGSNYIVEYRTTGAWTAITSGTFSGRAGAEVDCENYLDKTFIVGYDSGTFLSNATISTTTMSTADTDLTDMPQGKFIVRYRDLLYVLHTYEDSTLYPSRGYFCDEPTAGAIGWTTSTRFVEFGYDDGDEITGGVESLDRLIVFKHYSMWKYDEVERKKISDIGCDSYRSINKINNVLYWFNRGGVYRWAGDVPQLISGKVQKFIDAIDQTTISDTIAGTYNEFEYRLFIGTVTVDGITYTNCSVCFDTQKEKWYIRSTFNSIKSMANYEESGKRRLYFGDDDGFVYKFADKVDEIYADDGNEIDSFFITKALDYGIPESRKFNNEITVFSNYAAGMKCAVEKDNIGVFKEENIPILVKNVHCIDISAEANRYRYKFYEKSNSRSWEFEGIVAEVNQTETDK